MDDQLFFSLTDESPMTTSVKSTGVPNTFLTYSRWDVISAFHKELRRGDFEQASYWLEVMTKGGAPASYILSYLWSIGPEELSVHETELMTWLGAVRENADKTNEYFKYYAVYRFCKAKKWWECEESKFIREMWAKNQKELHDVAHGHGQYRDFPHYVFDKHTSRGQRELKAGTADRRWEGTWSGMVWRAEATELAAKTGKTIHDITWEDVWDRPQCKGQLAFWDWMEKEGM